MGKGRLEIYSNEGIKIGDLDLGRVCGNCRYWVVDVQLRGVANGVICTMGKGHTDSSDTCPLFSPNTAIQKPNLKYGKKTDGRKFF